MHKYVPFAVALDSFHQLLASVLSEQHAALHVVYWQETHSIARIFTNMEKVSIRLWYRL